MALHDSPVAVLSSGEAWDLLSEQKLGRLAVQSDDELDIFPVNFIVDGDTIVFRTADGAKLTDLKAHSQVSFEADGWDDTTGFSIVVKGHASPITSLQEIAKVEALRLRPWVPTIKTTFVRIIVSSISARRFHFGPDPIVRYR
ncbi:MAG: pyridoxamine 5'-phosphate oxidase family protein [Propionibacteriaceae bacterium]|jgi:nitroimidazol reductase NimA-like FMN-containing flavoprotein (pyridoxamine 5'-phosphate oxidase superfamily)|nr:pyridoxamine 5'-phosphate oxidase family protein [Propionibacteriaceae bacterium]